jgi:hypothetical protein
MYSFLALGGKSAESEEGVIECQETKNKMAILLKLDHSHFWTIFFAFGAYICTDSSMFYY